MTIENERLIILDILMEILEEKRYSHLVIGQALDKYGYLPKKTRAFISRVSRGCVEQLLELDAMIDQISAVKTEKMKPVIRNILRMAAYQLRYTQVPSHAVCNEAVKLAQKKGFAGLKRFVNGVVRNMERQMDRMDFSDSWSLTYSVPEWMLDDFCRWYGKEKTKKMLDTWKNQDGGGIYVHFHLTKADSASILSSLEKQGVSAKADSRAKDCYYLTGVDRVEMLEAFQKGWIQVQDISSALAAQCAAPEKGTLCLDLCSAPGGKSIWMAESMNGTGLVDCRDISAERLARIEENRQRCGLSNMVISCQDACTVRQEDREKFDLVLADVPCSGLGVIGRKPDIKYTMTEKQLCELSALQRRILMCAAACVKPGGVLVYSTCTVNPGENRENAEWFLRQGGFSAESLEAYIPGSAKEDDLSSGMIQLLPGQNTGDGFFIARFRKEGEKFLENRY